MNPYPLLVLLFGDEVAADQDATQAFLDANPIVQKIIDLKILKPDLSTNTLRYGEGYFSHKLSAEEHQVLRALLKERVLDLPPGVVSFRGNKEDRVLLTLSASISASSLGLVKGVEFGTFDDIKRWGVISMITRPTPTRILIDLDRSVIDNITDGVNPPFLQLRSPTGALTTHSVRHTLRLHE